jgi:hypothetical protein
VRLHILFAIAALSTLAACDTSASNGTEANIWQSALEDEGGEHDLGIVEGHHAEALRNIGLGVESILEPSRVLPGPHPDMSYLRPRYSSHSPGGSTTPTDKAILEASLLSSDEIIEVFIKLDEVDFDFTLFQGASSYERGIIKSNRVSSLDAIQNRVITRLEELGASVLYKCWLVNALVISIPAGLLATVASIPDVATIYPSFSDSTLAGYDGAETRDGTLAASYLSAFINGETGGRTPYPTDNIKVGVIENNFLNLYHVGWWDYSSYDYRVINHYCGSFGCIPYWYPYSGESHATWVTSIAAGSIEENQDPNFPGTRTYEQARRSGIATEADIYFYYGGPGYHLPQVYEVAIEEGIDLMNISMSYECGGTWCETDYNCDSINEAIRNALDAGIVTVVGAGNSGHEPYPCTLYYPAFRSEAIAVAFLNSLHGNAYNTLIAHDRSSHGPFPIRLRSGFWVETAGVDITAPGVRELMFAGGSNNYATEQWGSSLSTAEISGAIGIIRDMMNEIGWWGNNPRAVMVNSFVMGDALTGRTDPNSKANNYVSVDNGFGRIRMHRPSSLDLVPPWGWGWRTFVIHQGETIAWTVGGSGPESSLLTQWKWAFFWDEFNMKNSSDVVIHVWDTCPSGGGAALLQAFDMSFSYRKRIRLVGDQIHGKCLEMRAYAYETPPEGVRVYSADYYHSGDISLH